MSRSFLLVYLSPHSANAGQRTKTFCIVIVALSLKTSELLTGEGERWKRNKKRREEKGGGRKREKVQDGERKQRREKGEREGGEEERRETMVISHC